MSQPQPQPSPQPPQLDFEALLSREYRPARVSRLIPREAWQPDKNKKNKSDHHHHHHKKGAGGDPTTTAGNSTGDGATTKNTSNNTTKAQQEQQLQQREKEIAEETSRLVLSLVTQTPAFTRHLNGENKVQQQIQNETVSSALLTKPPPKRGGGSSSAHDVLKIEPAFHEIELGDWESKINWEGSAAPTAPSTATATSDNNNKESSSICNGDNNNNASSSDSNNNNNNNQRRSNDPMDLLTKPRNHFLDNLNFDDTVCWDGDTNAMLEKARNAPLVLELGVAGHSVARHVYQNTVLSAQRPTPALKLDAYQVRREAEWSEDPTITSTADVAQKGSLHADKEKMEALIAARQKLRAQMAKDKTNRVQEAMGTLALGGGRGRTITSSLMGPGGTERTGRPSIHVGASVHDTEYIEQLDLVNNHVLVRDLSKVMLREWHRPKLPMMVVRLDLAWQFQIRYLPSSNRGGGGKGGADAANQSHQSSSYQSIMHTGAISKQKLRTEADLTPTEGKLVLLEYCEERPPVMLDKAMAFKIVNYYRGDKARCPVSAGGGDRPTKRKTTTVVADPSKKQGSGTGGTSTSTTSSSSMPRLALNSNTTTMDWVGKLPKKSSNKDRSDKDQATIDILPEGVTEMLHPKGT